MIYIKNVSQIFLAIFCFFIIFSNFKIVILSISVKTKLLSFQGVRDLLKTILDKAHGMKSANNVAVMNQLRAIQKVSPLEYIILLINF